MVSVDDAGEIDRGGIVIDFTKITKTLGGLDCYYIGQRESLGRVLHIFAVFNDQGETFQYYDEQGRHLVYAFNGYIESPNQRFDIVAQKPMKKVTLFKWVSISGEDGEWILGFSDTEPTAEEIENYRIIDTKRHEFTFEVPG